MDNLQEFRDPVNYDLEELPGSADRIAFMCRRALRVAGPALDLGCGTGIVALPLAVMGLSVTGLDLSDAMVAHARHKAATLGVKVGALVQPVRVACTGTMVGPSLYHLMEVLGRERVAHRMARAAAAIGT
jgi:predicted RNA methylase